MRMSCNGCRVLRKGCSENCTIRPCLKWIERSELQANATVFLAKFYGRAGLLNLINSGPEQLRPAIFRSLLYEACGRIVNPIYGSVGLMYTARWNLCEAAVRAVLMGSPIIRTVPFAKAGNIRHKDPSADHRTAGKRRIRVRRRSGNESGFKPVKFQIFGGTDQLMIDTGDGSGIDLALGLAPPNHKF